MTMRYIRCILAVLLLSSTTAFAQFDPRPSATSPAASGARFDHPRLANPFFVPTTYVGAFAPGGERWDLPWAEYDPQNVDYGDPATAIVISGQITSNQTWTANNRYKLNGFVDVMEGVTLTIEPGTIIFGQFGTRASLIINRGARLIANGTPTAPIVFTSDRPRGQRANGDWGGLIIAGRAGINVEGGTAVLEGGTGTVYGGGLTPNDDDDSGIIRFVRVEFSGAVFEPDNEINGISMGGVGRGTVMEFIQVSFNLDDAFQWYGGTVNGRYFISYSTLDDDFDGDIGWRGNVQFGLIIRDPALSDVSTSNAFEQDNAGSEPIPPHTPRSRPTFSNVTVIGPLFFEDPLRTGHRFGSGVHVRRASRFSLFNSIVAGFPTGLRMDGPNVRADAEGGELQIQNSIFTGGFRTNQAGFEPEAWLRTPAFENRHFASVHDVGISNPIPVSVEEGSVQRAAGVALVAVFPNPAAGTITIALESEALRAVEVRIFDMLGRRVASVHEGYLAAGSHALQVDVSALPSGPYLVQVASDGEAVVQRFTVVR